MSDLNGFSKKMTKRAEEFTKKTNVVFREMVISASTAVIQATPVDTGRARNNWIVSINAPVGLTVTDGSGLGNSNASFDKSGSRSINQVNSVMAVRQPGQTVYLQNNLPYIGRLNNGYSSQAPANFVETAVHTALDALDGKTFTK